MEPGRRLCARLRVTDMTCAVMCCGCGCLLGKSGERIPGFTFNGGIIDLSTPITMAEQVASFDSERDADKAASASGWQIVDIHGPNHRCPLCVKKELDSGQVDRQGAYIYLLGDSKQV